MNKNSCCEKWIWRWDALWTWTIGGKSFAEWECKIMVLDMDLSLECFMKLVVGRPIVRIM